MKYSRLFGKTVREEPKNASNISHKLLYKAGFIRESVAGRYYFLTLGNIVRKKIMAVIKEEMDKAGAQEVLAPTLHPLELWEETNRVSSSNFELMTVKDRRGAGFALGGTAEEMIVDLVRKFQISYRDLPFNLYQFSTKFRDEIRAKGGLIRAREFTMKDGYSFHATEEDFDKEYQNMSDTYSRLFSRLGLDTIPVPADNGYFGGDYCHEFDVLCDGGESLFFTNEDGSYIAHEDIAEFKLEDMNPDEEILPMEIIEQPEWVKTMDDNQKHYGQPIWKYLKNVVYKNRVTGEIIIASIRGDLDVNKNKLEHVLDAVGLLDDASDEDLESIGTKSGYVHCWGNTDSRVKYVGDNSLRTVRNFIGGQKSDDKDSINVNYGRDFEHDITADIALAKEGFYDPQGKSRLTLKKGLEVGNIFQLGQHYPKLMKGTEFDDADGKTKMYYMGCYGIGVERTLAAIVECHNDSKGIIWPDVVSPFKYHLISDNDPEAIKLAESIYEKVKDDCLWDERSNSMGEKFADADLIGCTYRIVCSKRSMQNGGLEVKRRDSDQIRFVKDINELLSETE